MVKLVCFSPSVFRYSFFAFCFLFSFFGICFSLFVIRFSFIAFRCFFLFFSFQIGPNIVSWHSKSYFDIRTWDEYHIVTFKILFWHSNWGPISYFDIQSPILTFKIEPNVVFLHLKILFWHSISDRISYFDIQNPILTLELRRNIILWHLKSYFDIQTRADICILTFKIVSWHSNRGRISYFDIQNPILTFEIGWNIVFWHSN